MTFNETEILTADDPILNTPVPRLTSDELGGVPNLDLGKTRNPINEGAIAQAKAKQAAAAASKAPKTAAGAK